MVHTDDIGDLMGCYDGYDGPTNEPDFTPDLDDWWRHNGCWDRQQASGIPYEDFDGEQGLYLQVTDDWWEELTWSQKMEVYEDFFSEV